MNTQPTNRIVAYAVDIQNDFMNESNGRLYVPHAEFIKSAIAQVEDIVSKYALRRIRSRDRHFADDAELLRNGGPFPDHCMDERYLQQNEDSSFGIDFIKELDDSGEPEHWITIEGKVGPGNLIRNYTPDQLKAYAQADSGIILEKQDNDVFTNVFADMMLDALSPKKVILYGVATEYCVKYPVYGLQEKGIQVYVVKEAIQGIEAEGAAKELLTMQEKGVQVVSIGDLDELIRGELNA